MIVAIAPGVWSVAVGGSMIWLVCPWSAVTMISVSGLCVAKSSATWMARSNSTVSPICPQGFSAWSCLSIDAPSTWR
jgi:hypothetical protein